VKKLEYANEQITYHFWLCVYSYTFRIYFQLPIHTNIDKLVTPPLELLSD
jgi:hypothetical protein